MKKYVNRLLFEFIYIFLYIYKESYRFIFGDKTSVGGK